ncbi:hypothetical protein [Aestuariivirga sp.]|uniref:hypothetical protein n=1 Tax=Aestuariivirga sp. TaxID=2650926 RepID=UPI003BABF370
MYDSDMEQQKVMSVLNPYLGRMYPIFSGALDKYNSEVSAGARAEWNVRAVANVVWCHAWEGFRREFIDEAGFHFLNVRGLDVLNIRDELVIRVKKVDENGRHQNADTAQQRAFDQQLEFPELPGAAARVVIGYQPDEAFSEVERVIVRRPLGRWVSQIVEIDSECQWIDITPIELPFGISRRSAVGV